MTQIGRYHVHSMIGEGHIGRVYRAADSQTGRDVALKILRQDSPTDNAPAYFVNESVILAQLTHRHIPAFFEASDDPAYIALELIEGQDGETLLAQLPQGEFFPAERIIRWGIQICDALMYLHQHQPPIAFRDLKASHLMIDQHDNTWLVDFNLAKILPPEKYLRDADLIGTEGFAAPEQFRGVVSPLADIYGLGATLHYLATRIDPRQERLFTYAPPASINRMFPKHLARVMMTALAYEAEDRYPSAADFKDALLACL